ncbi:MAG TPA: adenylate/guanylate cyclase domain-containing protein, partial [Acidimicrobiales bacterium]|nr:adenylate/guanylate cyclase domain-containing protein [Acidimicrobiales bacterium]
ASGPVLAKDGDYFGPVVNLASRLVSVAYPGTVLVSADTHEALADDARLAWRQIRPRRLKDIGTVPLWAVYRVGDKPPPGASRRRFGPLRDLLEEAHLQRAERRTAAEPGVKVGGEVVSDEAVTPRRGAPSRSATDPKGPSR